MVGKSYMGYSMIGLHNPEEAILYDGTTSLVRIMQGT